MSKQSVAARPSLQGRLVKEASQRCGYFCPTSVGICITVCAPGRYMYNVYCNYFECSPYAFQIIASGSKAEQQGPCDNTYEPPE